MKKIVCLCISFLFMLASFAAKITFESYNDTLPKTPVVALSATTANATETLGKTLSRLTTKDLSIALKRRLTLKEKISWFFFKKQLRSDEPTDADRRHANNNALLGFIFSILGVLIFPLFAIPALILSASALRAEKANKGILTSTNRGLALAGKIISIAYIVILIILVAVLIVLFTGGGIW